MAVGLSANPDETRKGLWARLSNLTMTFRSGMVTVAETSSKLRKILLACARSYSRPILIGHEAIEGAGHEGDLEIKVHFEADHRGKGIEVKELNGLRDGILNEHAVGVTGHQPTGCRGRGTAPTPVTIELQLCRWARAGRKFGATYTPARQIDLWNPSLAQ
jgi:hypothetical protein